MEKITFKNVTFTYPLSEQPALKDISFSVRPSEFIVVCGKSGCGKSTLLRHLKQSLMPYGEREGEILYEGEPLETLDERRSAAEIGYVQQNPDNQLVTDKVWHELAFGLENLGLPVKVIKRRVAEMTSYFGIQTWFRRDVHQLSGGQKQLLNLASVMAMQPELLILDEPASQLDPIAASDFLETVYKINRDLGTTVIISEHRLEEVFPMADRVMVMDEGKIIAFDTPGKIGQILSGNPEKGLVETGQSPSASPDKESSETGQFLSEKGSAEAGQPLLENSKKQYTETGRHPMFYGLPTVMRMFAPVQQPGEESPLTIREGRLCMEALMSQPGGESSLTNHEGRFCTETQMEQTDGFGEAGHTAQKNETAFCKNQKRETNTFLENDCDGLTDSVTTTKKIWEKGTGREERKALKKQRQDRNAEKDGIAISMKELWFRYEKDAPDVLRGLTMNVKKGEWYCLLGGNGTGKSTTLKAICNVLTPQRGTITVDGIRVDRKTEKELFDHRLAMVPQNPQSLFTEITVEEELLEGMAYLPMDVEEKIRKVEDMLKLMEIQHLRKANPYDLSGGEQQRLAIGKVLLLEPSILLLDEPTKGLDPFFKRSLAKILGELRDRGVTLFMVSHDIEFCAAYGDICALFFDGEIVSEASPKEFFAGNNFYTTTANKIVRKWHPEMITCEEVSRWLETLV